MSDWDWLVAQESSPEAITETIVKSYGEKKEEKAKKYIEISNEILLL